jgi:hypothetical protein
VIYHDYAGLYFNDSAVGHGVTGKWNDINNWWLDVNATIHSPVLPTAGDSVIISSGTISTTTASSTVYTATFFGTSTNAITITVTSSARDAALFNASSTNDGTIIGNATFAGTGSVNNGTVTGYITRQYSTGMFTVVEDFTHNGIHWVIQAVNGATVDLTGATYSLLTNIFEALSNGVFIFNNLIGGSVPDLVINSPTTGTNIKWAPDVEWDTNTLCQYKMDSGSYVSLNCSLNGSDIPKPTAGSHTIFLRSTDADGNSAEKTVLFTYDNTQPIDTDCSTPLDEATRPYYYLTSNVGNCSVTATTTLRGDDGAGNYYSAGAITGNGTSITIQNLSASGLVSGFNTISVASSTLSGSLIVNGSLTSDTLSSFGSTTVAVGASLYGGSFTQDFVNRGTVHSSTTLPVTVTGSITNHGTINTIGGAFIFNASSTNYGTVNGDLTLNGDSSNQGTVNGNVVFNTLTGLNGIVTISDNTVFRGTGTTTGSFLDNRGDPILIWHFEDSTTNIGTLRGTAYFEDTSSNLGLIIGNVSFSDSATNSGTVQGNAQRYRAWLIAHELGGTVTGTISYYSYPNSVSFRNISGDNDWSNTSNWFRFVATTTPLGRTPVTGEDIVLFASTTLKSNITNDLYIGSGSTTINGAFYTVTGSIYGNGAYHGNDAYNFNLDRIRVTGTTTATGGDGIPGIDGGNGGNINIQYSSTWVVSVNGGDPLHNGGDAGTIYAFNTIAIIDNTPILAVGGDSFGCGFGGNGGNVTLVDTSGYVLNIEPGRSATTTVSNGGGCDNPISGTPPGRGQVVVSGVYNPSLNNFVGVPTNQSDTQTQNSSKTQFNFERFVPIVDFDLKLSPFSLTPLPTFGTGENSFSFISRIKNFFSAPLPQDIQEKFSVAPNLLSSLGLNTMNDLIGLKKKPILIEDTKLTGIFSIYSNAQTTPLTTYIRFDTNEFLVQTVHAKPGQELVISLVPIINNANYAGEFNGEKVSFVDNVVKLKMPTQPGVYVLSTALTPIVLKIQVSEVESPEDYSMKERTVNLITIVIEGTKHAIQNIQQIITDLISEIIQLLIKIYQHIQEFIG